MAVAMSDAPEVHTVIVQVRRPKNGDEGQVTEGRYIVVDGKVILTDTAGKPVREFGKQYSQKISEGDDPRVLAGRLTKELRNALLGKSAQVAGFSRALEYKNINVY
jgi:hypothetical protein